jgi:glycerol-3-phosphate cytidylyltransferase-like family protein
MTVGTRDSIKKSMMCGANSRMGICEKIRFVYDEVYEIEDSDRRNKITELLVDVMVMAKKMDDRLCYYQKKYREGSGNKGRNLVKLTGVEGRKNFRRSRSEKL